MIQKNIFNYYKEDFTLYKINNGEELIIEGTITGEKIVGLEFMVGLDIAYIKSYEDNIRPVIEELIKQINSVNIKGFRGFGKTCWLSYHDTGYNEMVLDFTL